MNENNYFTARIIFSIGGITWWIKRKFHIILLIHRYMDRSRNTNFIRIFGQKNPGQVILVPNAPFVIHHWKKLSKSWKSWEFSTASSCNSTCGTSNLYRYGSDYKRNYSTQVDNAKFGQPRYTSPPTMYILTFPIIWRVNILFYFHILQHLTRRCRFRTFSSQRVKNSMFRALLHYTRIRVKYKQNTCAF